MKYIILILSISFYLDGILSNFISLDTKYFNLLLSLMTLVSIYPFFKKPKKYYQICLGYGIVYDLVYTDTLFFHGFLFLCMGFIAHYTYKMLSLSSVNTILIAVLSIFIYRTLSYTLLCLIGNYEFVWLTLLRSITSSLILNIMYMLILYIFFKPRYHYIKI